jgi:hypothetical protein
MLHQAKAAFRADDGAEPREPTRMSLRDKAYAPTQ